ncbi:MAG: hypothetical protein HPY85_04480 [Anaerolineae bacterium]|nr:hypothetical protein [Anaerolineae bacterium]
MRLVRLLLLVSLFALITTACAIDDPSAKTVESYLNAVVAQDEASLTNLVCEDFIFDAMLEMDSFLAVSPALENVSCSTSSEEDSTSFVKCTGSILATYNDEQQSLDLSNRTFIVVENAGERQVCGYQGQ